MSEKHRKINNKARCYCGSKMFIWKRTWICKNEFIEKAKELNQVAEKEAEKQGGGKKNE